MAGGLPDAFLGGVKLRKPLIAVVDDDTLILRSLQRLLSSAGYEVKTSRSGGHLAAGIPRLAPDCILLDLEMPEATGFAVMDWLGGAFPIIAMTGHDSFAFYERAKKLGVAAYLRKPLDRERLLEAIDAALPRSLRLSEPAGIDSSKIVPFPTPYLVEQRKAPR
ncbi:MAG: response regulator [Chthoniobacteraceae bacterium]